MTYEDDRNRLIREAAEGDPGEQNEAAVLAAYESSKTNPDLRIDALFTKFEDAAVAEMNDIRADNADYIAEPVTVGIYRVDGRIYKVLPTRDESHLYAKRLDVESGKFAYERGAMRDIRAVDRLTLDEARAYGRLTGHCIVCAALLTDPESIEYGIGPVCRKKFD